MTSMTPAPRPTSVTIVIVLIWIGAILDIIGGIMLFFFADESAQYVNVGTGESEVKTYGLVLIAIGLFMAFLAWRLGSGGSLMRFLVSLVMILRIMAGVWLIIRVGPGHATEAVVTVTIAAITLYLLWNHKADRFFDTN